MCLSNALGLVRADRAGLEHGWDGAHGWFTAQAGLIEWVWELWGFWFVDVCFFYFL